MKKTYSKPEILFESFALSTSIAAGCEGIVGNATKGTCAVLGTGGIDMFEGSVSACVFTPPEGLYNGFCYHVPIEEHNLFNS